jgi:hypothetical protein
VVWIQDLRTSIEEGAAAALGEPPSGHGPMTLEAFFAEYNRDLEEAVAILEAAGLVVDPGRSMKDIEDDNGVEALDILDLLRKGYGE